MSILEKELNVVLAGNFKLGWNMSQKIALNKLMQIVLPSYSINTKDNERMLYQSMKQRDKRSDLPSPYLHQFVHFESIEYKISGKFTKKK